MRTLKESQYAVEMTKIVKKFGEVKASDHVDFAVRNIDTPIY